MVTDFRVSSERCQFVADRFVLAFASIFRHAYYITDASFFSCIWKRAQEKRGITFSVRATFLGITLSGEEKPCIRQSMTFTDEEVYRLAEGIKALDAKTMEELREIVQDFHDAILQKLVTRSLTLTP